MSEYIIGQHNWKEVSLDKESIERIGYVAEYFLSDEEREELDEYEDAIADINRRLLQRLDQIIEERMTEHQKRIIYLRFKCNLTYSEIAKTLGKNYTCVPNAILGIKSKKYGGKYHGGILKKLKRYALKDEQIQQILEEIKQLKRKELPSFCSFLL